MVEALHPSTHGQVHNEQTMQGLCLWGPRVEPRPARCACPRGLKCHHLGEDES